MAFVYAFIFCQSSYHHNIGIGALYHYVALGKTLSPHIYKISGDDCSIEDIERFINDQFSMFEDREEHDQMLHVVEEPFVQQNDPFDSNGGHEKEIYDAELVRRKFSEAFDAYKDEDNMLKILKILL